MFEFFMEQYGVEIFSLLVKSLFACLGMVLFAICKKYLNDDTKQAIAKSAMMFVEQTFKTLHGREKLEKALETAAALLKKKGIKFDADEMMVLIEAAVAEFNAQFKKPLTDAATADATRRIDQNTAANEPSDTAYNKGVNAGTM